MTAPLVSLELPGLQVYRRGKVRETWDLGDRLLMVASDRISAFDVVLPQPIPDKGRVLAGLSCFWFERTRDIVPNHLLSTDVADLPTSLKALTSQLAGRFMIVRKAQRIDVECVVRGYLSGSAWQEYRRHGTVCEERLPAGLVESDKLPEPMFTPATKADAGHDENISVRKLRDLVGDELTQRLVDASMALYRAGADYAAERGLIIADTKFEFGFVNGQLTVIDEMLTPDSSRFWDAATYVPGRPQESFDKQPVRDWLIAIGWDKSPPAPDLPDEVVEQTAWRYREAYRRLIGRDLPAP